MEELQPLVFVGVAIVAIVVVVGGILGMVARFYKKVDQGRALIVNKLKSEPLVTFTGSVVLPVIHRAEEMVISLKTVEIERRGEEGLICKDNVRADIRVSFFVRVNKTKEDVLKVAQAVGCMRASDAETMQELFAPKFSEALKTVGKLLNFEELYEKRAEFRDEIIQLIGQDLNGYVLEDAAIDYLEQTPLSALDPDKIHDSEGIRKITALTTHRNVETNELKQKERMDIASQNLAADEAIFRYDEQRAAAEAKKQKEIAIAQERERHEAERYAIDQKKETELARYQAVETTRKREQDMQRGIEVAERQRQRVVAVESVEVQKAEDLKQVERQREVELRTIEKNKALEHERKEIADVIRARIAVEKSVAEEEERIKELRLVSEAQRTRDAVIIQAEGEAQSALVKTIKAAEAKKEVAEHTAKERKTLAEADRQIADLEAAAKIRLAEGVQAEVAAEGMAHVRVKEADAAAIEKVGLAEARVTKETMLAEAEGREQKGMAEARVGEAEATVIEKKGRAQADVLKGNLLAEAEGNEQKGLAVVRVREKEAAAIEQVGRAEAVAVEEKLSAEAAGLAKKAEAMAALDERSRQHEEYRIKLEAEKEIALERLRINRDIAREQAEILSSAFGNAKFNIVGGDGAFFDRFVKAVSVGQSIDGVFEHSEVAQQAIGEYISGEASLREDIKEVLTEGNFDAESLQQLSVANLLTKLAAGADESKSEAFKALAKEASKLGLV